MKEDCLKMGMVQAFMDGELAHDDSARVSAHVAVCDECALMLAEAEDESAMVFPALEREFNSLVPTQRLWNRINDSIAVERENRPFWQKIWGSLNVGFMTPSMVAAASLLLVVGVVALALIDRGLTVDGTQNARPTLVASDPVGAVPIAKTAARDQPSVISETASGPVTAERADYRPVVRRNAAVRPASVDPNMARDTSNAYMPGEEIYVRTIASLSRSVDGQKDNALRGSERVSFERDMAVVDDAIAKMRAEVKKDPKNESAKQVLYSSYQNKIDLLNTVSQKEELVASLK